MDLMDHVKVESLDEDQKKMVELVGLDGFKNLVRAFGGSVIYIPKAESLERAARDKRIREEFNGANHKELAAKYGLTERWVRAILLEKEGGQDGTDLDGQMSIYDYPNIL